MKYWQEYYLAEHKRKHFAIGEINIGDFDKIISYMHLNLQLRVILMCVCRLPKWQSRYGSQSTSVKYLLISDLSLAECLYWRHCFLPIPLVVTSSPQFFIYIYSYLLVETGTLNKINCDGKATFGLSILFKYCSNAIWQL